MVDVDVLIVGAGLSGIGLAHELQTRAPTVTFELLEARGATGGTWDLFRYPGIRSDSDLYTFGFRFRPWRSSKAMAAGDQHPGLSACDAGRRGQRPARAPSPPGAVRRLVESARLLDGRDRAHRHG